MEHDGAATDEKKPGGAPRKHDMDARFFAGCLTISVLSIALFFLQAWPFFVFEAATIEGLSKIALAGCLPTLVIGALIVRKFDLEGGTALIGGTVSAAVFAFLRMDMVGLGRFGTSESLIEPDYPGFWVWMMPALWGLLVTGAVLAMLRPDSKGDKGTSRADR